MTAATRQLHTTATNLKSQFPGTNADEKEEALEKYDDLKSAFADAKRIYLDNQDSDSDSGVVYRGLAERVRTLKLAVSER